jgi:hypothetical protein
MDVEPIPTATTAAAVPRCRCTGIRRCGLCNPAASPTDSAASPLAAASGEPPLPRREWAYFSLPPTAPVPAEAAEAHAAAPALRPPTRWLCPECGQLVVATESPKLHPRGCAEHVSATDARVEHRPQAPPAGLHFISNFVSEAEEAQLIAHLDGTASSSAASDDDGAASSESSRCRWVPSQSGRSKYEIGPQANFKQRKCKLGPAFETGGFDRALRPLLARAAQVTNQVLHVPGNPPVVDFSAASTLATGEALSAAHAAALAGDFVPVEFSCLDYRPDVASNLDPHVDDEWAWGGRVLGVSLLCDAVMTFVQRTPGISCSTVSMTEVTASSMESSSPAAVSAAADDHSPRPLEFRAVLPRRALFTLAQGSRHEWLHGIASVDIPSRRVSITIREFASGFLQSYPDLVARTIAAATLV